MMYVLEYLIYHLKPYGVGVVQQCSPPPTGKPHNASRTARSQGPGPEGGVATSTSRTETTVRNTDGGGAETENKGSANSFVKSSTEGSSREPEVKRTRNSHEDSVVVEAEGGKKMVGHSQSHKKKGMWIDKIKPLLKGGKSKKSDQQNELGRNLS